MALSNLPAGPGNMEERKKNVSRSLDLWSSFIGKLEELELLSNEEVREYHELMEDCDVDKAMPPANRDVKIARFKAKQLAKQEVERLKAQRERRTRCGVAPDDDMDGHNEESLERSVALRELTIHKGEAFESWSQSKREIPMILMMVKMEEERQHATRHNGATPAQDQRPPPPAKPLQLTHITKDYAGTLQIKKEEILSKVFRPGWNQPTMSLEELGEREYHQAMEREERQKISEAEQLNQPRRYEDLVRDGMEDNAELAEASAKLDRDWDDWKAENPTGSGNKRGNQGDRNF
jgi:hypothetical protein